LKLQEEYLRKKFGRKPNPKDAALGLVGEIGELVCNSTFLPWKKQDSLENIKEELIDCLFFLLELFICFDMDQDEVNKRYCDKLEHNLKRDDHVRY